MQLRLNQKELKRLIEEIIDNKYTLDTYCYDNPVRAIANPPASDADLTALEIECQARGVQIPPSYRQFLKLFNGISHLFDDEDLILLSVQEIIKAEYFTDEDEFPGLSKFVIGAGNTPEFISFDTNTIGDDNEMEVVHVGGDGDQARSQNLIQFFLQHHTYIADNLRLEREDREDFNDA